MKWHREQLTKVRYSVVFGVLTDYKCFLFAVLGKAAGTQAFSQFFPALRTEASRLLEGQDRTMKFSNPLSVVALFCALKERSKKESIIYRYVPSEGKKEKIEQKRVSYSFRPLTHKYASSFILSRCY